jgi:hypothetical protein
LTVRRNTPGCATCCGPGSSSGGAFIPGCVCTSIPTTLTLTWSGTCDPSFSPNATLLWGPTPSAFSGLGLGTNCFLSTAKFLDPYSGCNYYFTLSCTSVFFQLSRIYDGTGTGGGCTIYHDLTIFSWSISIAGNSCVPFLLANGTIFSGGNIGCHITVSG